MKKLSKRAKITFLSNIVIVVLVVIVMAVCFVPDKSFPIYGGKRITAIYHGNKSNANVSIMINVYENTKIVNDMVDVLTKKGVKATFFVGGCWADDNAETLKKIVSTGNELGNHGYFHKDHKTLSYDKNVEEIKLTGVVVKALCNADMTLFAPPSGSFSSTTLDACQDLKYTAIMWSKDTIDWRDKDTAIIYKRATSNPENGDLILMHPKEHTLKVLPDIIDFYLGKGFNLVTVSENIKEL